MFVDDLVSWNIDIANYGVILQMKRIAIYNGVNVWLGIGTNLRNTEYHSQESEIIDSMVLIHKIYCNNCSGV